MKGFRKIVGKFPALLSTMHSRCPCVETIKRAGFSWEKVLFVFVWALDSEHNNIRFFNEKFFGRLVKTAHYVTIGEYRGENFSFFLFFWFVVKMSKKDLDFRKERQGGIYCIILSNIYLTFIGKSFWEVSLFFLLSGLWRKNLWLWSSKCRKWCRNCIFLCPVGHFEGEKLPCEKTLVRFFFWFWPKKSAGDFDGVHQNPFFRVQMNILRSALQKLSSFFKTLGVWIKAVGFSRKHFQWFSKVHSSSFQWKVDHFEKFFCNFCCFSRSLFDFHRNVSELISAELRKMTNDIPNV